MPMKDSPVLLNFVISDAEMDSVFMLEVSTADPFLFVMSTVSRPPVLSFSFYLTSSSVYYKVITELKVDST